jgi:cation diffusion facilitator family transporter
VGGERKTVLVALGANAAIAIVKGATGAMTGSAAMLAEAAHSVADTVNQGLLLTSLQLGDRPPDEEHPFGHGKERFFWAFLAAVLVFVAGALFSIGQGVLELISRPEESSFLLNYATFAFAFVAESVSLVRAVRQTRGDARAEGRSFLGYVRTSTEPTSKMVLGEDAVAVVGVVIGAAGVALHQLTGNVAWDAAAAILIGLLLMAVAITLGRSFRRLLIGEGALPEDRERLRAVLNAHDEVEDVVDLRTMYVGPKSLLVAVRLDLVPGLESDQVEELAEEIDRELREAEEDVSEVFIDPTPRRSRPRQAAGMTATPGSSLPSSSSRAAPPPVESHET